MKNGNGHRAPPGEIGTIYLIHLDRPYQHARHYLGWTIDLDNRFHHHSMTREGSPLLRAAREAGIKFEVVRTWQGTRDDERRMHKLNNGPRLCPVCREERKKK